jgi:flagellar protein FliS
MVRLSLNGFLAYKNAEVCIDTEDKPRLLIKVYEELLKKLDIAAKAAEEKDFKKKVEELSKAISVLEILDSSLDMSYGEIPRNLSILYTYILKNLRFAQRSPKKDKIEECKGLLSSILEGFRKAYEGKKEGENRAPDHVEYRIVK